MGEKYRFVAKKVDGIKRTLSDILDGIQSEFKVVNIDDDGMNDKELDKILRGQNLDKLRMYQSNIDTGAIGRMKIKIAMIRMKNHMIESHVDILKQNLMILKQ